MRRAAVAAGLCCAWDGRLLAVWRLSARRLLAAAPLLEPPAFAAEDCVGRESAAGRLSGTLSRKPLTGGAAIEFFGASALSPHSPAKAQT
jgi:hypothetical protein